MEAHKTKTLTPPEYFERVKADAAEDWEIWQNPRRGGAVQRMFQQVTQTTKHVLSELLQNADDANASFARVWIEDGVFHFEHDGDDFSEQHFGSLCRFGYSNKRELQTIGFRGVGFKSTFSLGDEVHLHSPTLAVKFEKSRFSDPIWTDGAASSLTRISVRIKDDNRLAATRQSLESWHEHPASLLFFRNIRSLIVDGTTLTWQSLGPGPIPQSEWMAFNGDADCPVLLLRSDEERFPQEAATEIEEERIVDAESEFEVPSCKIDIAIGAPGRLFAVLPTGVETGLPFAINAPFIQDPARVQIRDLSTSPTNRWILERAGGHAARAMLAWLNSEMPLVERIDAYDLLPIVGSGQNDLASECASAVAQAFLKEIGDAPVLLTDAGAVVLPYGAVAFPKELRGVWPDGQLSEILDGDNRPSIAWDISDHVLQKLQSHKWLPILTSRAVSLRLCEVRPPTPGWRDLVRLWSYLCDALLLKHVYPPCYPTAINIVPVQAESTLAASAGVVRLGKSRLLAKDSDWEFLSRFLRIANPNWHRNLADLRLQAEEAGDYEFLGELDNAGTVLQLIGHANASDADKLSESVCQRFFGGETPGLEEAVRMAQVFAALDVDVSTEMRYYTPDEVLNDPETQLVFDIDGLVAEVVPSGWAEEYILDAAYSESWRSCTREEWDKWIQSGKSGLVTMPRLEPHRTEFTYHANFESAMAKLGYREKLSYPYAKRDYSYQRCYLTDFDFPQLLVKFWEVEDRAEIWSDLMTMLLKQPESFWSSATRVQGEQTSTNGGSKGNVYMLEAPAAKWIRRFKDKECLRDDRGQFRLPSDLFLRCEATEPLTGLQPFVAYDLDKPETKALLRLLGVRDRPEGPTVIIDRLRVLSKSSDPPVEHVYGLYWKLDGLLSQASTDAIQEAISAFEAEALIYATTRDWLKSGDVFQGADEDQSDLPVIPHSLRLMSLWHRLGVAERPTCSKLVDSLKSLPQDTTLSGNQQRLIKNAIRSYPEEVWTQTACWLTLDGTWSRLDSLRFSRSMLPLTQYGELFPGFKAQVADFRDLNQETIQREPFCRLPPLYTVLEERLLDNGGGNLGIVEQPWLKQLGRDLARVELSNRDEQDRVRKHSKRLYETAWVTSPLIETVPYVDDIPVGAPRTLGALWIDKTLLVENGTSNPARAVAEAIHRVFERTDVKEAVLYCFDRPPERVTEYLESEFKLVSAIPEEGPSHEAAADTCESVECTSNTTREPTFEPAAPPTAATAVDPDETISDVTDELESDQDFEPRKLPRQPSIAFIEKFAIFNGFRKADDSRYVHPGGHTISKAPGEPFPYVRRDENDKAIRHYIAKEHCLERDPLELTYEQWGLLERSPERYSLVLVSPTGDPVVINGEEVVEMVKSQNASLNPATFRLRLKEGISL